MINDFFKAQILPRNFCSICKLTNFQTYLSQLLRTFLKICPNNTSPLKKSLTNKSQWAYPFFLMLTLNMPLHRPYTGTGVVKYSTIRVLLLRRKTFQIKDNYRGHQQTGHCPVVDQCYPLPANTFTVTPKFTSLAKSILLPIPSSFKVRPTSCWSKVSLILIFREPWQYGTKLCFNFMYSFHRFDNFLKKRWGAVFPSSHSIDQDKISKSRFVSQKL